MKLVNIHLTKPLISVSTTLMGFLILTVFMSGWIKLHRSITEKGWFSKPEYLAVWIHLLVQATHEPREYFWNGKTILLAPGQFITGRSKMAANTGVQESKVERILKCFESEQQIEQQKTSTSRLISIINWQKFQDGEQPFEQRTNNERTTSEQRVNTKQELKNLRIKENTTPSLKTRPALYVDYLNKVFGRNYKVTPKVIGNFSARIEKDKYPAEVLRKVVDNLKLTTYHIETKFGYCTPEFCLRQSTIEKYKSGAIIQKNTNGKQDAPEPPKKQDYSKHQHFQDAQHGKITPAGT